MICGDYYAEELERPTPSSKGSGNPLKFFDAVSRDVFMPLMHSAGNVGGWPDTLQKVLLRPPPPLRALWLWL